MSNLKPPKIQDIRLLIHGWELPSFRTPDLRAETRRALRHALERGIGGLRRVVIDFDDLTPQRPRDPEELARWKSPIREAIDMEFTCSGHVDEETQMEIAQQVRPAVSRITMYVLRKYVEADAWLRENKRKQAFISRN